MSAYAQWTREAVALWPRFATALQADTGIDLHLRQPGGFQLCLSDEEMAEESRRLLWLREAMHGDYPFELLDAEQLRARLPGIGPTVVGACYSPMDGHINPLKLLRSLYAACRARGVNIINGHRVSAIAQRPFQPRAHRLDIARQPLRIGPHPHHQCLDVLVHLSGLSLGKAPPLQGRGLGWGLSGKADISLRTAPTSVRFKRSRETGKAAPAASRHARSERIFCI